MVVESGGQPIISLAHSLVLLNIYMNTVDNKLRIAAFDMLSAHRKHCTHAITLTLKQTAWIDTARGKACTALTPLIASRTLRNALNRLNRQLYGNGFKRKPNTHKLLVIATLEGVRSKKRLHYHLQIGNVPRSISDDELQNAISLAWTATDFGDTQINLQTLYGSHWLNYITKEIGYSDTDCIDWLNTHIPEHLSTD